MGPGLRGRMGRAWVVGAVTPAALGQRRSRRNQPAPLPASHACARSAPPRSVPAHMPIRRRPRRSRSTRNFTSKSPRALNLLPRSGRSLQRPTIYAHVGACSVSTSQSGPLRSPRFVCTSWRRGQVVVLEHLSGMPRIQVVCRHIEPPRS